MDQCIRAVDCIYCSNHVGFNKTTSRIQDIMNLSTCAVCKTGGI